MKTLYIVRHAKSSWDNLSLEDTERPLNKRGLKDAPKMAKIFASNNTPPDLVISSPARRALETAEHFSDALGYDLNKIKVKESVYEASLDELFEVIMECKSKYESILLFSHNPGLTKFINYFSPVKIDNLPTCGIFCLEFKVNKWSKIDPENCDFIYYDYPKKHKK
jgi:phosphohistidine phosphatase